MEATPQRYLLLLLLLLLSSSRFLVSTSFAPSASATDKDTCTLNCVAGWGDCDGLAGNGCEAALDSDTHCGACGKKCLGEMVCVAGTCEDAETDTTRSPKRRTLLPAVGQTYTEDQKANLLKYLDDKINRTFVELHPTWPRNRTEIFLLPKYHWQCPKPKPWRLVEDGVERLGLIYVITTAQGIARRAILRDMYRTFSHTSLRVTFALGFPDGESDLQRRACHEQLAHGDLSLINMKENLDDGKTYYAIKYIQEHFMTKPQSYRYLIKLDDDSAMHIPSLLTWMSKWRADLSHEHVVFGQATSGFYYLGAVYGISTSLVNEVIDKVPAKYRGSYFEDALSGAWMRIWGTNVVDVRFNNGELFIVSCNNLTEDEEWIRRYSKDIIVIHQRKDVGEFLYLYQTLVMMMQYKALITG